MYLIIFMATIINRISFFLNAVSNYPIYFTNNIKIVSAIIWALTLTEVNYDIF